MFQGSGFSLKITFKLLCHYLMTLDVGLLQRLWSYLFMERYNNCQRRRSGIFKNWLMLRIRGEYQSKQIILFHTNKFLWRLFLLLYCCMFNKCTKEICNYDYYEFDIVVITYLSWCRTINTNTKVTNTNTGISPLYMVPCTFSSWWKNKINSSM